MHAPTLDFVQAGRLPSEGDNVAIAIQTLPAGTRIRGLGPDFILSHTVLEGHRFAIQPINRGQPLLSWKLPFGHALRDIAPGEYACNDKIIKALKMRDVPFELPEEGNFINFLDPFRLNEATFKSSPPLERKPSSESFFGYYRSPQRGVGTRNYVLILNLSSRTNGLALALAEDFKNQSHESVDGVVALAHTEAGETRRPNHADLLIRTFCGYIVHSNTGGILILEHPESPIPFSEVESFLNTQDYPWHEVPLERLTVSANLLEDQEEGRRKIENLLSLARLNRRTEQSVEHLKIALQCGGSDAFSGISGNPLAGRIAKELIQQGGQANLAETDELIGAEPYLLNKCRNLDTARKFLLVVDRFKAYARQHGYTAEANPSGGNNYRGLYNIAIKSIGAGRKKDPEQPLDFILDYGERMNQSGYYFMDSPGNDLESIAGQVASGCNLILFVTGNGSVTNFPFVPTLKIVTTTRRFELLSQDMDINAGRYLDGESMDDLTVESFQIVKEVCSGKRTVGEKAGHSQIQLWREWRVDGASSSFSSTPHPFKPQGINLAPSPSFAPDNNPLPAKPFQDHPERRGLHSMALILPTSLCASQVAGGLCGTLNRSAKNIRYVALRHTEGCGNSDGDNEKIQLRTLSHYLIHPLIRKALLLEHGCEKTHNDAFRHYLKDHGIQPDNMGWASIQMDGGIEKVSRKIEHWFEMVSPSTESDPIESLFRLGWMSQATEHSEWNNRDLHAIAFLFYWILKSGGAVVIPEGDFLLTNKTFLNLWLSPAPASWSKPSIRYGDRVNDSGLYIMECPSQHPVEKLSGLGASGIERCIQATFGYPIGTHPFIPTLRFDFGGEPSSAWHWRSSDSHSSSSFDLFKSWISLIETGRHPAQSNPPALVFDSDFQLTRGYHGISM